MGEAGSSGNATGISVDRVTDLQPPRQDEDASACSRESTALISTTVTDSVPEEPGMFAESLAL